MAMQRCNHNKEQERLMKRIKWVAYKSYSFFFVPNSLLHIGKNLQRSDTIKVLDMFLKIISFIVVLMVVPFAKDFLTRNKFK